MFVHLRLHTEFSVVDGTNRIDEVVAAAAANAQPALAITDLSNLFGAVKFYKAARGAGLKPLLGAEVTLQGFTEQVPGAMPGSHQPPAPRVVLLVQDKQGYLNLSELLARAWTRNDGRGGAVIQREWLTELNGGLILLAGAQAGPVGQALMQGDTQRATDTALQLASVFTHRFYIELQRAGRADDERHVVAAVQLAARLNLPVVATHPVQFLAAEDYEAHEARVCIADGEILGNRRRVRRFTREQYFKSAEQMAALFADVPSAVANTLEIARRCNLSLVLGKPQLPDFPTPVIDGVPMPMADFFRQSSFEGLEERLAHLYPDVDRRDAERPRYVERLEFEINTILNMGFPGYFLIVGDFINWAKKNGCPVGPGRGSGAGSLVAYALKITDLDPLGVHARLRHRFLPDQPRPGDRLCEGQIRQERGEPDRHLRYAGGARGDPRCGPCARFSLRLLRQYFQAHSEQAGQARHHPVPTARGQGRGQGEICHLGRTHAGRAHSEGRRRQDAD